MVLAEPQYSRCAITPLHEKVSACEIFKKDNGSELLLTCKEQSRDEREGKKPTRERQFASWVSASPRNEQRPPQILTERGLSLTESTHLLSHHRWSSESDTP